MTLTDRNATALAAISLAAGMAAGPALAGDSFLAGPAWRAEGFQAPESVLVDAERDRLVVSNVAGAPTDKNGEGHLSLVGLDGELLESDWATGMDAPKGLGLVQDTLYVADIDRLHEVDVATGEVTATHQAQGAQFLNDVAADSQGRVYVSDMLANRIYRLAGGELTSWLADDGLRHPNELLVVANNLKVASWGPGMNDDMTTETPGSLLNVELASKDIAIDSDHREIGNLDGLAAVGDGDYVATDWMAGPAQRLNADGRRARHDLPAGSADLDARGERVYIPLMQDGAVVAYDLAAGGEM